MEPTPNITLVQLTGFCESRGVEEVLFVKFNDGWKVGETLISY